MPFPYKLGHDNALDRVNKHVKPAVRQGFKPLPQSESPRYED